ncbi:MAG: hypothetical protein LBG28_00985 [Tannerella sp.]|jgi:hypothetical protein|nr:hypothetical protein [Tannerella sp.]
MQFFTWRIILQKDTSGGNLSSHQFMAIYVDVEYVTIMRYSQLQMIFFEGARYSDKVLSQMENTLYIRHGFPKSVDGYANEYGYRHTQIGGDGQIYQIWNCQELIKDKLEYFNISRDLMELLTIDI